MDETAALCALDDRLRGVPQPDGSRMAERGRRIRLAYLEGAEAWSREMTGRGLTEGELGGDVRRFPLMGVPRCTERPSNLPRIGASASSSASRSRPV